MAPLQKCNVLLLKRMLLVIRFLPRDRVSRPLFLHLKQSKYCKYEETWAPANSELSEGERPRSHTTGGRCKSLQRHPTPARAATSRTPQQLIITSTAPTGMGRSEMRNDANRSRTNFINFRLHSSTFICYKQSTESRCVASRRICCISRHRPASKFSREP